MIKRLLTDAVRWLAQPVAGDLVTVVDEIVLGHQTIPVGTQGYLLRSSLLPNPDRPQGRVLLALPDGPPTEADVWPWDSDHPLTWHHLRKVHRSP